MLQRSHIPWSRVLMIGSLGLLAAFEFFWLRSEYQDERRLLHEQQTIRLHSAIRELEDSLFQLRLWTPASAEPDSFGCKPPRIHFTHGEKTSDSARYITVTRTIGDAGISDSIRIHHHKARRGTMFLGALSRDIQSTDSLQLIIALPDMIYGKLNSTPHEDSDLSFRLIHWVDDPPDSIGLVSKAYFDVPSGTHYALEYPLFKGYLLQQIYPQILFAILLFSCIAGAFWVISQSMRRQRRLAEMRSDLISNISHELKTPIATVRVALEALHSFQADADQQRRNEYLQIAQSEVDRLGLLVDKVLKSSANGHPRQPLHIENFDLRELTSQILDTLKVQLGKEASNLKMATHGEDFSIEGDKLHLTGLIHNLVDNAVKYSGKEPRVDIDLSQNNGVLILRVKDQGIGIPKEYRDKIFEKFFRVPSGDVHNIKGHGLGLSYVAEVVREHHGTIDVSSDPGTGSTFTVTLPRTYAN